MSVTIPQVTIIGSSNDIAPWSKDGSKRWDRVTFFGGLIAWEGKFQFRRAARDWSWDMKDPPGVLGATQTFRGRAPRPFDWRVFLYEDWQGTRNMWVEWQKLSELLFQYEKSAFAISVSWPGLDAVGIDTVICRKLGVVEQVSDDGLWAVDVELEEFAPIVPKLVTQNPNVKPTPPAPVLPGVAPDVVGAQAELILQVQYELGIQNGFPSPAPPPAGSGLP